MTCNCGSGECPWVEDGGVGCFVAKPLLQCKQGSRACSSQRQLPMYMSFSEACMDPVSLNPNPSGGFICKCKRWMDDEIKNEWAGKGDPFLWQRAGRIFVPYCAL
eukprot:1656-Pelagomonas_calceolata.AAC.2